MFRGKNPKNVAPGATETLRLTSAEINEVLAWGSTAMGGGALQVRMELADDVPYVLVSARSPYARGEAKYINIIAGGYTRITDGELELDLRRLRVGSLEVPRFVLAAVSPQLAAMVTRSPQAQPVLEAVRSLRVTSEDVSATYGRVDLPPGTLATLFEGEALEGLRAAVEAHTSHLVDSGAWRSPADRRFGMALQTAFHYARERSKSGDPKLENQAAIVALGMLLGHPRIEQLVGSIQAMNRDASRQFEGATLRQRADWTKHFFVSAALSVLSTRGISDGVGLFKEELDADGGSGFSFGDLLADRAGLALATAATRDDESAIAMQERLARPFRVDDVMPHGADLPENLQDAEFRARFGGGDGPEYRRVAAELERRISECAAYRRSG
jgi:hypothetical protein